MGFPRLSSPGRQNQEGPHLADILCLPRTCLLASQKRVQGVGGEGGSRSGLQHPGLSRLPDFERKVLASALASKRWGDGAQRNTPSSSVFP